jgi:ATP-dependent DNA ligase
MDSFNWMQRISKANTNKGKCKPSQEKCHRRQIPHPVHVNVFHIPYLNGQELWKENYEHVYAIMHNVIGTVNPRFFAAENLPFSTPEDVEKYLRDREGLIEGLVVWCAKEAIEIGFNGKPKRRAAYKYKIPYEDDLVAYDWLEGKRQGLIGSLLIGKYNHITGEMVPMGRVGSGIGADELDPADWSLPCVVEVEYQNRFPDGAFQFPVYTKVHEDKVPSDITTEDDIIFKGV